MNKITLFLVLALALFLGACQDVNSNLPNQETILENQQSEVITVSDATTNKYEDEVIEDFSHIVNTEKDYSYLFPQSLNSEFITYSIDSAYNEEELYGLKVQWANDNTAFALGYNADVTVFIVDTQEFSVEKHNLGIDTRRVRDSRVINDKLLISSTMGFHMVDVNGNIEDVFIYEAEQARYDLSIEKLCSESVDYVPVISDNLQYISYFQFKYNEEDGAHLASGKWEIILIDLFTETKSTLIYEEWPADPEGDGVIGKCPIEFSSDSKYLFFNHTQLAGHSGEYFGGRIDLSTKEIEGKIAIAS